MKGLVPLALLIGLLILFSPTVLYTINEDEQAVVLQFRNPVRVIVNRATPDELVHLQSEIESATGAGIRFDSGPGLYLKLPFIQSVRKFEARYLEYDEPPRDIVTRDKYQLSVDCYARWKIVNPLSFLKVVDGEETRAQRRLSDFISSGLRETLGRESHYEVVRSTTTPIMVMGTFEDEMRTYQLPVKSGRETLMRRIAEQCDAKARGLGIKVADVRVKRVDFLEENADSVYQRMTAERERIATRHLNEGLREAEIIRSDTDRRVKVILAEAEKKNLEIQGKADAEAARIYAEGFTETLPGGTTQRVYGYGDDPEFFEFLRKLEALKLSVNPGNRLILSTDSPLFQVFNREDKNGAEATE